MTIRREAREAPTVAEAAAYARGLSEVSAADPIVAAVQRDLAQRSAKGVAKYGTTLARTDLGHADWLRHAYEEALDLACYLRRALAGLQGAAAAPGAQLASWQGNAAGGDPGAKAGRVAYRVSCRVLCVDRCDRASWGVTPCPDWAERREATGLDYRGG